MKLTGEHRFAAPRDRVWQALLDPEVLAGTLPGFQRLERVGDHEYAGTLALGVGPVQGRFDGRVQLTDLQAPEAYRLQMSGRGTPGYVDGTGSVRLTEDGDGTVMSYEIEVNVGGRIAGVGQRLLEMTGKSLSRQALDRLAHRIETDEQQA